MPRIHLIILACGVLLIIIAGLGEDDLPQVPERVVDVRNTELGEPDLFMETAEISQFAATGELSYRIRAVSIVHYPDADHTQLEAPRLMLYRADEAPWEVSALHGRIIGGGELLDAGILRGDTNPEAGTTTVTETVFLEQDVVVQRQRPMAGFLELKTDALTLYPQREYAETDHPVIIDTESGRTTATGLRADFTRGRLDLSSNVDDRVRTTIFPGTLQ